MKDAVETIPSGRTMEQEPFANRKLIRPTLTRAEHAHHNSIPVAERSERRERPERNERADRTPRPNQGDRKLLPPEQTNAENFYYQKQMLSKTPMVLVLRDGEQIHGCIEWYDKCCLKVNRIGAPNLMVYKPAIKYMYKESEST